MAGGALQLHIMGEADHDHVVSLSAEDVRDGRDQKTVARESTTTLGHSHTVTFNCSRTVR